MTASCSKACPRPIQTVDFKAAGPMSDQTYECETTSEGCPVERLRTALAEAHLILEQHEVMAQEYQQLKAVVAGRAQAAVDIATLTPRQHEILELVLIGTPSKNIAADLHISQRTVENHRAAIMKKTHAKSLPALGRIGLTVRLHEQYCTENADKQTQVPEDRPPSGG
jgi:DNA-binding NarL/FixJ family response regulator